MASKQPASVAAVAALVAAAMTLAVCSGRDRTSTALAAAPPPIPDAEKIPVFPGAEGFGSHTRAGRGGKLFAVTSLADSGPGTLREALLDGAPKTIVFRVGGIIELKSHVFIGHPFVTIAGQTAPGDGIVLKDFGLVITTHDVLVQSIRVRPGNKGAVRPDHNDAIAILGPTGNAGGAYNVVVDHVSASWGEDETISTWFGPHDITVSWSIVSEALNRSRHDKGTHSAGLLVGNHSERVSVHHNLLAHNDFRNPLIIAGGTHDVVNNVVYDWGSLVTEVVNDFPVSVNIVGNWYKPGPSSKTPFEILINPPRTTAPAKLFVARNAKYGEKAAPQDDWSRVHYGWKSASVPAAFHAAERFETAPITTIDAAEAMELVLATAGATAPRRDAIDRRIVADVKNGTGSVIDTPDTVGGYPPYERGVAPVDTDGDGIPDDWEGRAGLDPNNPADANADRIGDGYTNLERYLQSLMPGLGRRPGRE
jgi:hypothetical protein